MTNASNTSEQQKLRITPDLTRIVLDQPSGETLKRAIVFIAYPWLLHHQLDFAFAHALKARGIEVSAVLCNRVQRSSREAYGCEVLYTEANPEALCTDCHQGFPMIFQGFLQLPLDAGPAAEEQLDQILPDIAGCSLPEAIDLKVAGVAFFQLAYSTLCTRHRVAPLDQLENWRLLLSHEARVAARIWMALDQHRLYFADKATSTAALIFNGRFTPYRVAYAYFQSLGIDRLAHERGGSDGNYSIVLNKMCTDPHFHCSPSQHNILQTLPETDRQRCIQLAAEKLTAKMQGINTGWFSWVSPAPAATAVDEQPQPAGEKGGVVCMFTSSPDEVDYKPRQSSVQARQLELLAGISSSLRAAGWQSWIRHHPNTSPERNAAGRGVEHYIAEAIQKASAFNRTIMGNESVNSVELAQSSSACIALTSSICLEIAFCTRKCIIDATSLFASLFPQRMVLCLDPETYNYTQQDIDTAINAQPMNDAEYEHFLLGVYQIYFINKYHFESFGYVETIKIRSTPEKVLQAIPHDQLLAEISETVIQRRLL